MIETLLEFVALLRKNGVRVSTAETLDAARAVEMVGIADPSLLASALSATLVKRPSDVEVFDELFDLFFYRAGDFAAKNASAPLAQALREQGFSDEEMEALLALLADQASRMSGSARMALGMGRGQLDALLRRSGMEINFEQMVNPLQVGYFTQQVMEVLELRRAERELHALVDGLAEKLGAERAKALSSILAQQLAGVRAAVRRFVEAEFERRNLDHREKRYAELLADKPFSQMSDEELKKLRLEVDRLAKKLRSQASLRPRTERRGRLDARRTIRRSLMSGGVPFLLVKRRRRIEKPRLVVLCDISDSVRSVSRFMLQLCYTLQDRFGKVRSFVFVSDLGETTDLFSRHEIQRAVDLAYGGAVINVYANSNFGRAFRTFHERYLDAVNKKTTVIVIGDGRSNYQPPEAWVLGELRTRAKKVLWLNPEPRMSWNFGDSVMRVYEPHCDRVEVVQNLQALRRVVDGLML